MEEWQPALGDRVVVSRAWYVECFRGASGTIATPPDGVTHPPDAGVLWVEFDEPFPGDDPLHPVEAAEIDAEFLSPALR